MANGFDDELRVIDLHDINLDFKHSIAGKWSIDGHEVIGDLIRKDNQMCLKFKAEEEDLEEWAPDITKVTGMTRRGISIVLMKNVGYSTGPQNKEIFLYFKTAIFGYDFFDTDRSIEDFEIQFQKIGKLYNTRSLDIDFQDDEVKIGNLLPESSFRYGADELKIKHSINGRSSEDEMRVYFRREFSFSVKEPISVEQLDDYIIDFGLAFSFCIKDVPKVSRLVITKDKKPYHVMTDLSILSRTLEGVAHDPSITLKKHPEYVKKLFMNWPKFIEMNSHCIKRYIPIRVEHDTDIEEKVISLVKILECLVKDWKEDYSHPGESEEEIDAIIKKLEEKINTETWDKKKSKKVKEVLLRHGIEKGVDDIVRDIFSELGISNINRVIAKLIMHFRFVYEGDSENLLPVLIATCINLRNVEAHGGKRERQDYYMLLAARNLLMVLIDSVILENNMFGINEIEDIVCETFHWHFYSRPILPRS